MTALFWIWIVVGVILLIMVLIFACYFSYIYLDERENNDEEENRRRAKDVLLALLGIPAATAWPLTLTGALLYGGWYLIKSLRQDLKKPTK